MKTPAMDAWMKAAPRGKCPGCRKPLPMGKLGKRLRICRKRTCWRQYYAAYRLDHMRPNVRRVVVAKRKLSEGEVELTLDCGHLRVVPRGMLAVRRSTRECKVCIARRAKKAARAAEATPRPV